jgi:magnesium chelatase subunit D
MAPAFPFSAIVGQALLKRALVLGVIQPNLGGVLIRGTKGVAKSTAVRALAALLPPIDTMAGCPFQRRPEETLADWPLPIDSAPIIRPVPLVELPLGATEDRVLGTLHLEKALRGERAFEPGLLAAANRGILYIDEVNLLPDHLVDILLDAAAGGIHRVEREGLSLSHPARFLLVGTMNPEEGDLRPQLLDRFGLAADVADLTDAADRAEAVRRRIDFEADPDNFLRKWNDADRAEAERVVAARRLLPEVQIPDATLRAISDGCLAAGVEGLRADLTVCRAAAAWAAYCGRTAVEIADVDAVAELALVHRRTTPPEPPPGKSSMRNAESGREQTPGPMRSGRPSLVEQSAGAFTARCRPPAASLARSEVRGRWRGDAPRRSGRSSGLLTALVEGRAGVSWSATLRAAALRNLSEWRESIVRAEDLRFWRAQRPVGCLLFFVLDTSGSMAAWRRMRQTKAAVLALLLQAYQRRDRVALLAFHGAGAELVLPPTRGLEAARQALEELPAGGATPLAHGLRAARAFIRREQRRQPRQPIWTVLLTDGRANHALTSADPWRDALAEARALAALDTKTLVVDTETGWPRFGRAAELARTLTASCAALEEVLGRPLQGVRSA